MYILCIIEEVSCNLDIIMVGVSSFLPISIVLNPLQRGIAQKNVQGHTTIYSSRFEDWVVKTGSRATLLITLRGAEEKIDFAFSP